MENKGIGSLSGRNVLLLQGPMGPFFRKLDRAFQRQGARVYRICFNGGDFLFAGKHNRIEFTGTAEQWPAYISQFLKTRHIDKIFLYGDCRYYHRKVCEAASELGIAVYVFEEGYVRPNYITLEIGGVNARSCIPVGFEYYLNLNPEEPIQANPAAARYPFEKWTLYAIAYYLAMRLLSGRYPHYRHHRNDSVAKEAAYGLRNGLRKFIYRISERGLEKEFVGRLRKKYFFVPLQTIGDFQICVHSQFDDMRDFIRTVMRSFARYAPGTVQLVIKHHPMDRGRVDHSAYIRRLAKALKISGRVLAVHDVHLPTCLQNAIGTITINSTVGISSLFHGTPTIVLGKAVYDISGLTCKGMRLDRFWTDYRPPQSLLFQKYRTFLIDKTQFAGSFYSGFPGAFGGRNEPAAIPWRKSKNMYSLL